MARKLAIKMDELVDALDRLDESETDYFLDAQTGEVLMIGSEYLSEDEDGLDEFEGDEEGELAGDGPGESPGRKEPDWIRKERELAKRIAEGGDRYLLIEPFGRHEAYRLMQKFINSVEDAKANDRLQRAISGKGAFRRFKDTLAEHNLLDGWYTYEQSRKLQLARDWLESIDIEPA